MTTFIAALFRHPIKGFTPEKVKLAQLAAGKAFPGDRLCGVDLRVTQGGAVAQGDAVEMLARENST